MADLPELVRPVPRHDNTDVLEPTFTYTDPSPTSSSLLFRVAQKARESVETTLEAIKTAPTVIRGKIRSLRRNRFFAFAVIVVVCVGAVAGGVFGSNATQRKK